MCVSGNTTVLYVYKCSVRTSPSPVVKVISFSFRQDLTSNSQNLTKLCICIKNIHALLGSPLHMNFVCVCLTEWLSMKQFRSQVQPSIYTYKKAAVGTIIEDHREDSVL